MTHRISNNLFLFFLFILIWLVSQPMGGLHSAFAFEYAKIPISHRMLVVYSVLLIAVKVGALVATVALPSASLYSSSITPQNIVELTNATRNNLNLDKLTVSSKLSQAAQAKARKPTSSNMPG